MRTKTRPSMPAARSVPGTMPMPVAQQLVQLFESGNWLKLETAARQATRQYPAHWLGWRALGLSLHQTGRLDEALACMQQTLTLHPGNAEVMNDLAMVLVQKGRPAEARDLYRKALLLKPDMPEALANLGSCLSDLGELHEARDCLEKAIALAPGVARSHNGLGGVQRNLGQLPAAELSFRRALALDPQLFEAWFNLGVTLDEQAQWPLAETCYRQALALRPQMATVWRCLGKLLGAMGERDDEALQCLQQAAQLSPGSSWPFVDMGNILMKAKQTGRALEMFREAQRLEPVVTWPAHAEKPSFSALMLDTPLAGSTPLNYLLSQARFECHFHCLMPGGQADLPLLRARGQVVFNMIADADSGEEVLPLTVALADQLGLPVINHPRVVQGTNRASISRLLQGRPLISAARTERLDAATLAQASRNHCLDGFSLPVLLRVTGTHGGDDFEMLDSAEAVEGFVARHPAPAYYLIQYIDYRSRDGLFRKYRFINVRGRLYPYHLAIHTDWKVHHFRTDMPNQEVLRQEELDFLRDPGTAFSAAQLQALREAMAATGLDYCGVDCALDAHGNVLVFELNASMLVHAEQDEHYLAKNPYVARIKAAFEAMLYQDAGVPLPPEIAAQLA